MISIDTTKPLPPNLVAIFSANHQQIVITIAIYLNSGRMDF